MKAYCHNCMELRTDSGDDAWGYLWHAGAAMCQRCQSVVEFADNGQSEEDEIEQDNETEEDEDNGLFR